MITGTEKLSEVISRNIDLLPVVYRFGIKSGIRQKSIAEICIEKGLNIPAFLAVLNTYDSDDYFPGIDDIALEPLIDYLIRTHKYHREVTIPHLTDLIDELKKESPDKKFVNVIGDYFDQYVKRFIKHMEFEEDEIFPLIHEKNRRVAHVSELHLKDLFGQHDDVESEISDLCSIIVQHIPETTDIRLIHEIVHTLSHFEKEQIDHARFEEKLLVPKLWALLT